MFAEIMALLGMTLSYALRDSVETTVAIDSTLSESTDLEHPTSKNQLSWWGTTRVIKNEDVRKLPVRGVQSYILLSPGVVEQDGNLHVRGGRSDEIGYMIEGVSTRNVLTGQTLTTVIPEALEEVRFQPGVYSARFGLANSGLVNQEFRTGDSVFHANLSVETDNFTSQHEKGLGTYSYGYSNYVLTLSGPVIDDRVRLFLAAENRFDRDFGVQFLEGFSFSNLRNSNSLTDTLVPSLELKPGNMPGQMRNRYTANGTLTFGTELLKLRLTGAFTSERQQGTMLPVENIFNLRRQPVTRASDLFLKLTGEYALTSNASVNATVFYGDNRSKTFDPDHGDDYMMYEDSVSNAKYGYRSRSLSFGPDPFILYGFQFDGFGSNATRFEKSIQSRFGGSTSTTINLGDHTISAGGSFEKYRLRHFATDSKMLAFLRSNPTYVRDNPKYIVDHTFGRTNNVDNYGYDVYGSELEEGISRSKTPSFLSFYVEDVARFKDISLGLGFRYDIMNFDDFDFVDDPTTPTVIEGPANPSVDPFSHVYRETGIARREAHAIISPRAFLAFDPTDSWHFHISYGRSVQPPAFNTLYSGPYTLALQFTGGGFLSSLPIATHFEPVDTKQFEIVATYSHFDLFSIGISGFYKDITDQVHVTSVSTSTNSSSSSYLLFKSGDRATAKGMELQSSLQPLERLNITTGYTLSEVVGSGSVPAFGGTPSPGATVQTGSVRLEFSRTHLFTLNVDYRFHKLDGDILENLGFNLLLRYSSGHPYTRTLMIVSSSTPPQEAGIVETDPRARRTTEPPNDSTTPSIVTVDLCAYKTISFSGVDVDFFVYMQNLLNTKNEINVYSTTGKTDDSGFLTNPIYASPFVNQLGPRYAELYRAINLENGQGYRRATGTSLWGSPRQIRFGVRVDV